MKSQLSIVEKRAISSKKLQNRLNHNSKFGSKDLTKWLFDRYKIKKNVKKHLSISRIYIIWVDTNF